METINTKYCMKKQYTSLTVLTYVQKQVSASFKILLTYVKNFIIRNTAEIKNSCVTYHTDPYYTVPYFRLETLVNNIQPIRLSKIIITDHYAILFLHINVTPTYP